MFFKGSRYANIDVYVFIAPSGRRIRYKKIRLIPPTPARAGHAMGPDERLDHVAHRYYKDAERFWRICDANGVAWPNDLLVPGQIILIPPAEG